MHMGKINKDFLFVILFWTTYHETIGSIICYGTGFSWWWMQIPVILISLFMAGLTYGSQTKADAEWYEND